MSIYKPESPALRLMRLVYENGQQATDHSWRRLNAALSDALGVAIRGGLRFDLEDFSVFWNQLKAGYWIGSNPHGFYATACEYENTSACIAYETYHKFKPYKLDDQRVFVGRQFEWNGEPAKCTSISAESLTACSYKPTNDDGDIGKILHRYAITHEQIAAEERKRKHLVADKRMNKAKIDADNFARNNRIDATSLQGYVSDSISSLSKYDQKQVHDVISRRFKKTDKPTLFDLLAVGQRWNTDRYRVQSLVLKMLPQKIK